MTEDETEAQQLLDILNEDWYALVYSGDEADGFVTVWRDGGASSRWTQHISVVTQAPSGKYFMWGFEKALTEMQESEFYGDLPTEVTKIVKTIQKISWE